MSGYYSFHSFSGKLFHGFGLWNILRLLHNRLRKWMHGILFDAGCKRHQSIIRISGLQCLYFNQFRFAFCERTCFVECDDVNRTCFFECIRIAYDDAAFCTCSDGDCDGSRRGKTQCAWTSNKEYRYCRQNACIKSGMQDHIIHNECHDADTKNAWNKH